MLSAAAFKMPKQPTTELKICHAHLAKAAERLAAALQSLDDACTFLPPQSEPSIIRTIGATETAISTVREINDRINHVIQKLEQDRP